MNINSKGYLDAVIAGDSAVKSRAPIDFNRDQFEADLLVQLSGSGILTSPGGKDPRNWFCDKNSIAPFLQPGEDKETALKLAGTNVSSGRKNTTDGVLDMGISPDAIRLASSNGGEVNIATRFTVEFAALMRSIMPKAVKDYGLKQYFPDRPQHAMEVIWDVVDPYTGKTNQYVPGTDPAVVAPPGSQQASYQAPYYREQMVWFESELLWLRQLGSSADMLATRGAIQQISLGVEKLMYRLVALEYTLLTGAVFDNFFTYQIAANQPTQQFYFGIPTTNRVTPIYGPWMWRTNATSPWNYNSSSNPLWDMVQWWNNTKLFFKYRGMIPRAHMNPVTWGAFIQNPNVNSWVSFAMANDTIVQGEGDKRYSKGYFLKTFVPGLEAVEIVIEDGAWIPDANVTYDSNGYYENSTADFYFPDGMIFFGVEPGPEFGGPLGSFQQTIALQNGGIADPQPGRFIVMDDHLASGTLGGPAKPYMGLVAGVNGGVAIPRYKDVLTANVAVTLS